MSSTGPPPCLKKNAGLGCQLSMPRVMTRAVPAIGRPILPSSSSSRGELVAAAEEGVGRAAEPPAGRRGLRGELARLGERHAERLFRIDVLAGGKRRAADLGVRERRRQVDHELDRIVRQQRVRRHRADAVLLRLRLGQRRIEIGAGDDLDRREVAGARQVGVADVAAADDAGT